jgi:CRISPR-associated protein Csx16
MKSPSNKNTTWFVTRHAGAREWAARQGLKVDRVVHHLELEDVRTGDKVIGSLPVNLVAELNEKGVDYFHLILPLPPDLRGKEITVEMMIKLGAKLEQYIVKKRRSDGPDPEVI